MSANALGQGYQTSPLESPFQGIGAAISEIGKRKGAFQQGLYAQAMDHELTGIREANSDARQSVENEKTRNWQTSERREQNTHNARQAGAQLEADAAKLQGTLLAQHRAQLLTGIQEKNGRQQSFEHETARSAQDHQQAMEMAAHHAGLVEAASQRPRISGDYSSTGAGFAMRSDTEHRTIPEISAQATSKRVAGTPLFDKTTTENSSSGAVSEGAVATPKTPSTPRPAPKEDRSGGIGATKL